MRASTTSVALTALVFSSGLVARSDAIIRRHDKPDQAYVDLAKGMDAVVSFGGGTGTLVHPRWILTAAHVAMDVSPVRRTVTIGGDRYTVDKVVFHSTWTGRARLSSVDMALVRLTQPVRDVLPMPVYDKEDEIGEQILFVGPGMTGDGQTGPTGEDGRRRAATNTVEASPAAGWITFTFNAPPDGTEFEGISGPGDSGGPAVLERAGKQYVVGVSSSNDSHGAGPCRYGSTEYYARVSTNAAWLRSTMEAELDTPGDDWPDVQHNADLPDSPAGRVASAFFSSFAQGTDSAMAAFEQTWRASTALADRSVEERVARWPELRERFSAQTPVAWVEHGPLDLEVVAKAGSPNPQPYRSFRFQCEAASPHKLVGILIGPSPRPTP